MNNKILIIVLFTLFISLCYAGEEQATDQVTENKFHIKNIEKQQDKLSDRIEDKTDKQREYTDNEIQKQIDILLKDRNNVLCMREKWIDWVMMVLTALIAFFGIGVTIYFFIKGRKQSKEFEEQKDKISKILIEAETEQLNIKGESRKLQKYSQQRRNELDNLFNDLENKKKELDVFVEKSIAGMYELSKNSLSKDKKINPQLYAIIDDILKEKEVSNFDANDWIIKGNDLFDKNNYKQALEYYAKAISIDPKNSDAYNSRGVCYSELDEFKNAIKEFDKAIEFNGENHVAYCNRGLNKVRINKIEQGIEDINISLNLKPMYTPGYKSRAEAYYKLNKFDNAKKDLIKVTSINPQNVIHYSDLLELSIVTNDKKTWDRYYTRTIHLKKNPFEESIILYLTIIFNYVFKNSEININTQIKKIKQLLNKYEEIADWSINEMIDGIEKSKDLNKDQIMIIIKFTNELGNCIQEHNNKFK